jgi:hypothetical protein
MCRPPPLPCSCMVRHLGPPRLGRCPGQAPPPLAPIRPPSSSSHRVVPPHPDPPPPPPFFALNQAMCGSFFHRHSRPTRALIDRPPHRINLLADEPDQGGCPPPAPQATPTPLGPAEIAAFPFVPPPWSTVPPWGFFIDSLFLKKPRCATSLRGLFFSTCDHRSCPAAHRRPPRRQFSTTSPSSHRLGEHFSPPPCPTDLL